MIRIECVVVHYIPYRQSGKILKSPHVMQPLPGMPPEPYV